MTGTAEAVTVQLGADLLPAVPAVPGTQGGTVTVIADIPPRLLGGSSTEAVSPFVVRAQGGGTVLESYLEIEPLHGMPATEPRRTERFGVADALPTASVDIGDSAGAALPAPTVAPGRTVVTVRLTGAQSQWDTGGVQGVRGWQLWLDGRVAASVPTGGCPAGQYRIPLSTNGLTRGRHVIEIRVFGVDGAQSSTLERFAVA